jgi:CheY-like chemotaxis protein
MSPHSHSDAASGLLLSDDLIFTSRITGTARGLGLEIKSVGNVEALIGLARQQTPRCVILDLGHPGLAIGDLMGQVREVCDVMPRVVAYGSHVDAAGLRAAREAGCDPVLPRSKFVEELPHALTGWLG